MSARDVMLNIIPPQFDFLPFQIPPIQGQSYTTFVSSVFTIPANTVLLQQRYTIAGANINNKKVSVSCKVEDDIDYNGSLPFGIATWIDDAPATDILISYWNETNADIDVRAVVIVF